MDIKKDKEKKSKINKSKVNRYKVTVIMKGNKVEDEYKGTVSVRAKGDVTYGHITSQLQKTIEAIIRQAGQEEEEDDKKARN